MTLAIIKRNLKLGWKVETKCSLTVVSTVDTHICI